MYVVRCSTDRKLFLNQCLGFNLFVLWLIVIFSLPHGLICLLWCLWVLSMIWMFIPMSTVWSAASVGISKHHMCWTTAASKVFSNRSIILSQQFSVGKNKTSTRSSDFSHLNLLYSGGRCKQWSSTEFWQSMPCFCFVFCRN